MTTTEPLASQLATLYLRMACETWAGRRHLRLVSSDLAPSRPSTLLSSVPPHHSLPQAHLRHGTGPDKKTNRDHLCLQSCTARLRLSGRSSVATARENNGRLRLHLWCVIGWAPIVARFCLAFSALAALRCACDDHLASHQPYASARSAWKAAPKQRGNPSRLALSLPLSSASFALGSTIRE